MTDRIADAMKEYDEYQAMLEYEYRQHRQAGVTASLSRKRAKETVGAAYPDIVALLRAGMVGDPQSESYRAGRELANRLAKLWRRIDAEDEPPASAKSSSNRLPFPMTEKPLLPASSGNGAASPLEREAFSPESAAQKNGNRQKPGIVLSPSGYSKVNETVLAMIRAAAPTAGKTVNLGNSNGLATLIGCSPVSIRNVLLNQADNTIVRKAGYEFRFLGEGDTGYVDGCLVVYCVRAPQPQVDIKDAENLRAQLAALMVKAREIEAQLPKM